MFFPQLYWGIFDKTAWTSSVQCDDLIYAYIANDHHNSINTSVTSSCSSVAKSCPTLCNPMDYGTPGSLLHHYLPEVAQIHVHWVGDIIYLICCPLLLLPSVFPIRVFSRFFTSVGQSSGASASASVTPLNIQGWFPLGLTGLISLKSVQGTLKILLQNHSLKASVLQHSVYFMV